MLRTFESYCKLKILVRGPAFHEARYHTVELHMVIEVTLRSLLQPADP